MESQNNSGLTVAVIMLVVIVAIFGSLFLMESRKTRFDQTMMEEFVLRQRMERDMETLTILPKDRGVLITNKVMYANSPDLLKVALEQEGRAQQQQPMDPITMLTGCAGRPIAPQRSPTVEEMLSF